VWAFPQGFLGAAKKRGITVCSKEMGNHWMHQRKGESCWGLTRMSQARLCNKGPPLRYSLVASEEKPTPSSLSNLYKLEGEEPLLFSSSDQLQRLGKGG
jgi:hypothetical protein